MHRVSGQERLRGRRAQAGLPATRQALQAASRQAGKMLVPLLSVLTVFALVMAGGAIFLQMQEREKRQARERELQRMTVENQDLKGRLDDVQQAKAKTEEDLSRLKKDLAQAQDQMTKAVQAQEALTRSVEDRQQEITRLTKDLGQAQAEAKQATTKLSELQTQQDTVKQKLAEAERAKNELESKVMELSKHPTVELDKVLVTSDQPSADGSIAMPVSRSASPSGGAAVDGQVVVINREYDFIVVNLGKSHGLSVGQEFQVVRGDQALGRVKVEKVYDELSAAAILPNSQKDSIREGDTVRAL